MKYVYGCNGNKEHPRREVEHGMFEDPEIDCPACGGAMHRVPQAGRCFYFSPFDTLGAWCERNHRLIQGGSAERFSPNAVNHPDLPRTPYMERTVRRGN